MSIDNRILPRQPHWATGSVRWTAGAVFNETCRMRVGHIPRNRAGRCFFSVSSVSSCRIARSRSVQKLEPGEPGVFQSVTSC